jgi:hypothetical protein
MAGAAWELVGELCARCGLRVTAGPARCTAARRSHDDGPTGCMNMRSSPARFAQARRFQRWGFEVLLPTGERVGSHVHDSAVSR